METYNPFNVVHPAGEFFVGRERQLKQLHELLNSLLRDVPSNIFVVGKGGEGKTSYLEKIVEDSHKLDLLAFRCNFDVGKSAEDNIDTIMIALLRECEKQTPEKGLEHDWNQGKNSTFRYPRQIGIRSDDLAQDFNRIHKLLKDVHIKACVICIDEGQRIHPIALSALKNSLQSVKGGYMVVLSLLNEPGIPGVRGDIDNDIAGRDILNELASRSGDPGASRFFQNVALIGPFDTHKEAEECIKKRLNNNIIQFKQSAIKLITDIMQRHPSKIVKLANGVYEYAKNSDQVEAGEDIVHEAFLIEYKDTIKVAKEYRENLSGVPLKIYSVLVKSGVGITAKDIAESLYSNIDKDALDVLSTSVQEELERLCKTEFCEKIDKFYKIPEPEVAYALKIAIGKS